MVALLKWIKRQFPFIWQWIDYINALIVSLLYSKKISQATQSTLCKYQCQPFSYRQISGNDIPALSKMLLKQTDEYTRYFHPHKFDEKSLTQLLHNKAFLMLGAFDGYNIIGYHFIRFFANRQCFRGNIVVPNYQGKRIGSNMIKQMTEIGLTAGFRVFATVSKNNASSLASSKALSEIRIIEELPDNDLLIEHINIKP